MPFEDDDDDHECGACGELTGDSCGKCQSPKCRSCVCQNCDDEPEIGEC